MQLEAVSEEQARAFYRWRHIEQPGFGKIASEILRELVVDAGVHHGPRHAAKWLQWAADVAQDGRIGPVTLAAVNAADPLELYLWICAYRLRLFGKLVSSDPELQRAKRVSSGHTAYESRAGWFKLTSSQCK